MPPPTAPTKPKYARFFKCVPPQPDGTGGHLVARYGTAGPHNANSYIGARRDPNTGEITWLPDEVVAISETEAFRFKREYDRAVGSKGLQEVDEAAHEAWIRAQKERQAATLREMEAEAKRSQEAARATEGTKPAEATAGSDSTRAATSGEAAAPTTAGPRPE